MDCDFVLLNRANSKSLIPSYYEYYTNLFGENLYSSSSRKAIADGNYKSKLLTLLDDAYAQTMTTIEKSGNLIYGLQNSNSQEIAYFRILYTVIEDNVCACVSEIVLPVGGERNGVEEYKEAISSIETMNDLMDGVDILNFEVGISDFDMQFALVELGFRPIEENGRFNYTFMYEKDLRKKDSRLRSTTEE